MRPDLLPNSLLIDTTRIEGKTGVIIDERNGDTYYFGVKRGA